jgi:hypothetical protein
MPSNTAKHSVRILSIDPVVHVVGEARPDLELHIEQLLNDGFELKHFTTVGDGSGSPHCVALLVKRT